MATLAAVPFKRRLLSVLLLTVTLLAVPAVAAARVPQGFVGMYVQGPLYPQAVPGDQLNQQFDRMVAAGVQTIRIVVDWRSMQPYKSASEVPASQRSFYASDGVDSVPTQFGSLDALVGVAAQHGITVLPTVIDAPRWDAAKTTSYLSIPKSYARFGNFLRALVLRYGPSGSFWRGRQQKVPIRSWQIWNEPNELGYWPIRPFASSYVAMLRVAHDAIKHADRHAKIVLAGLSTDGSPGHVHLSWNYLAQIYRVHGARQLFDEVGVHPYTKYADGVITILRSTRSVMDRYHDRSKGLIADEMGWPSSYHQTSSYYGFETTEHGQAHNIAAVLPLLGKYRHHLGLAGFYYFDWAGVEHPGAYTFDFAGLSKIVNGQFVAKPGLDAFQKGALALEGCHTKTVATRCAS